MIIFYSYNNAPQFVNINILIYLQLMPIILTKLAYVFYYKEHLTRKVMWTF